MLFRPNHRWLQRLYLADLTGKSCPLHTKVGRRVHRVSGKKCRQGRPWAPLLLCIFVFLVVAIVFRDVFMEGPQSRPSSGISTWGLLTKRRKDLRTLFPTLNRPWHFSSPSLPLASSSSSSPSSAPRSTKLQELFVQGSLLSETPPSSVLIHLPWTGALFHGGEWNRKGSALFPVLYSCSHHCSKRLKAWPWLSFWLVFNQLLWPLMVPLAFYSLAELAHYFLSDQTQRWIPFYRWVLETLRGDLQKVIQLMVIKAGCEPRSVCHGFA